MRINNDCARRILLEVEKIPFGQTMTITKLQEALADYTIEDVLSIVTLYNREHYLTVTDKVSYDDNDVLRDNKIKGLTEKGYRTLDIIRSDDLWNDLKKKLSNFNDLSIYTLFDIAGKISNFQQNELFTLPKDLVFNTSRW